MDADLPFSGDFPVPAYCLEILDTPVAFSLWISDASGRIRTMSPAFLEMAGMRLEESVGPPWHARIEEPEAAAAEAEWRRCLSEGAQWEHEFRVLAGDGSPRHILSRGTPMRDAAGRIRAWVGINLDITGVREADGEVRRFRERVLMALSAGGDYLYEVDLASGLRRWFGPAEDLLGAVPAGFSPAGESPGGGAPCVEAAWTAAVHEEDRPVFAEARDRLAEGRGGFRVEYRFRRGDGALLRLLDRGRLIRGSEGGSGYLIGIVTDITTLREAGGGASQGEERRRARQRLEVIGRLAGGIAHDFNNLLTAINGFSELLVGSLEDGNQRTYAREILRAGERAALITRQLLAFGRRQVLAPRILDLNAFAAGIGRDLPGMLGGGISVTVRPDPLGALVKADPSQVEQVLVNLASRARESMPEGGRLLFDIGRAESAPGAATEDPGETEPGPGPYVVLTVEDDGNGMDEEELSHLFEPFFPSPGKPHGLGLSAVYGIVKQNGGHIVACSRKGEGTIFRIHWPRWTGAGIRENAWEAFPGAAASREGQPMVLVAEDEESTRDLVREILEKAGFIVLTAASGQEALDVLIGAGRAPDLLLADVVMPGMGGLELAGRLHPASPGMKVLFMSGFLEHQLVRQGVMASGKAFIGKPFAPRDLVAKIQEVLSIRQAA